MQSELWTPEHKSLFKVDNNKIEHLPRPSKRWGLTVAWAKARMWERLQHLLLCAHFSPLKKLKAKLHPSPRASVSVFVGCMCACVCLVAVQKTEASSKRKDVSRDCCLYTQYPLQPLHCLLFSYISGFFLQQFGYILSSILVSLQ